MSGMEELVEKCRDIVTRFEALCHRCRVGRVNECEARWGGTSECPSVGPSAMDYIRAKRIVDVADLGGDATTKKQAKLEGGAEPAPIDRQRGDSGYIHPDAWPTSENIGGYSDPSSTGRKRVAKMYPIPAGYVCEWARKKNCGGGIVPIIGCLGNPATDLHHGPDKNTLNNEKVTAGIGINENVHLICSSCHNAWHAANDPFYPPYDRVAQQEQPWLPLAPDDRPWGGHVPTEATPDELLEQERHRLEDEAKRGRDKRGRGAKSPTVNPDAWDETEGSTPNG